MKIFFNILARYQKLAALFLFLFGSGMVLWFGYQANIKNLQTKLIAAEKQHSINDKELQGKLQSKIVSQVETPLESNPLNLSVLSSKEILNLLTFINNSSRKSHWQLMLIEPMPVVNQSTFAVQPIYLRAECQYFQLLQFLQELTDSFYLFWIKDIELEKSQQMIAINILIEFYFKKS